MRQGMRLLLAVPLLLSPGCAATTETARVVRRETYEAAEVTAKAVTWPVREAVKMGQASRKPSSTPPMVATHLGRTEKAPARPARASTIDEGVTLASATDEEAPPPRRKKSVSSSKPKADPDGEGEDVEAAPARRTRATAAEPDLDDVPPKRQSKAAAMSDDNRPTRAASKKSSKWEASKPADSSDPDPDTIRIE
jgi:hypothetical protein